MSYGDPQWTSATSNNITWTYNQDSVSYPVVQYPFVALPVEPVSHPVDDSPFGWLRSQVSEICELARAA